MTPSVLWWSGTADYIILGHHRSLLNTVLSSMRWRVEVRIYPMFLVYLLTIKILWVRFKLQNIHLNEKSFWIFLCMNKSILKYSVEWRYCGRLPFKEGHGKSDKTNFSKHTTERLQMPILVLNFFMNSNNCTKRMRKCTWADSFVSSQDKRHPYWESTFLVQYKRKNISLITFTER